MPMSDELTLVIPAPKYAVHQIILALIDHQLRYAHIDSIHLNAQIVIDADGLTMHPGAPRWEYTVRAVVEGSPAGRSVLIAERTILRALSADDPGA